MTALTNQSWLKSITLIAVLMLTACGGSNETGSDPSVSAAVPASFNSAVSQKKSVKRKGLDAETTPQIMIGKKNGAVRQLGGADLDTAFPSTGIAGGKSAITQMVAYDSGDGGQSVAVAESDGSIWTSDGKGSWTNTNRYSFYGSFIQMVSYKNSIVATFSQNVVAQYVNGIWYTLHQTGWSPLQGSIMSSDNDKLVIALADGGIFDWDGSNHSSNCDGHGNSCGWTDLQGPKQPVNILTIYGESNGRPVIAIGTNNAQLWQYDGNAWYQLASSIAGLFEMAAPYQSQNNVTPSGFLIAGPLGFVELVSGSGKDTKYTDILDWNSTDPIRQLATRNGSVFAGMQSGLVLQATAQSDGSFKQQVLAKPRWGTELAQIIVTDKYVFIRYTNGVIEKNLWDVNGNTGTLSDLATEAWPQGLTTMAALNENLLLGFENGSSRQWNEVDTYLDPQPHDASWSSAVKRIVNWNRMPVVELANGAVNIYNYGNNWSELSPQTVNLNCNSDYLPSSNTEISLTSNNGLAISVSGGHSADTHWYSSYLIKNIFSSSDIYQTTNCDYSYTDTGAQTGDLLTQMVSGEIGIFAVGYDGRTIRSWSGINNNQAFVMTHPSWNAPISILFLFNDHKDNQEKLIIGLANGDIEQWDPSQVGNGTNGWSQLYDSIYNTTAPVTQIIDFGGNLAALLSNGEILLQYSGGWYDDHINYLEAAITQMVTIGDKLTVGLENGDILQWEYANPNWVQLPGNGHNLAVSQFATTDKLIVGYADGSVQQWDGKNWTELAAADGVAVTQLLVQ